jgi:hypothetical protein
VHAFGVSRHEKLRAAEAELLDLETRSLAIEPRRDHAGALDGE